MKKLGRPLNDTPEPDACIYQGCDAKVGLFWFCTSHDPDDCPPHGIPRP